MRFYVCRWPDFYAAMNDCDREVYQWIEKIPLNRRPDYLSNEMQRIANAAHQQQYQQWSSCESGRHAGQTQLEPGLRLTVASRLAGGKIRHDDSAASGISTRLTVPFALGSAPPPPTPCPSIPFHFLHEVDEFGINYYPQNTVVEFTDQPTTYRDGIGPWEGAKAIVIYSLDDLSLQVAQNFFRTETRVRSEKVFDHWASFKVITPAPPASLIARAEPFDLGSLQVQTSVPYNESVPEGQRGQGWHIFVEYTNVESGQFWVFERWLETPTGWNPVGLGGYGADHNFQNSTSSNLKSIGEVDGIWYHRVCVYDFIRMPTAVSVLYNGVQIESGVSSITPHVVTPYIPGVSAGIASVDETVTVRTVGVTKASFRILGVEPAPGFGVRLTIKVVNELHFAACIVTPSLTGIWDRNLQNNDVHFFMSRVWVVRNLGAHSESDPISILVPMDIIEPGDWPLRNLHWQMYSTREAYAAPLNQFADGIYGIQYAGGNPVCPYPNIEDWPPPGYKISDDPEQYAVMLACYLENGDKAWQGGLDPTVDPNQLLLTVPVRKAPGAEVPYVRDPRFEVPSAFDQLPFFGFFEWTAEYRVSIDPEVWEPRSGSSSLGLDPTTAIARYGRNMTLPVSAGRPMWSLYYQKWITVFDAWPGGDIDELTTYLVDTYLRPQFRTEWGWRNFEYAVIKPPYLTANVMWWFASNAIVDSSGYVQALTLIKEASSADTVDVMLMGYW